MFPTWSRRDLLARVRAECRRELNTSEIRSLLALFYVPLRDAPLEVASAEPESRPMAVRVRRDPWPRDPLWRGRPGRLPVAVRSWHGPAAAQRLPGAPADRAQPAMAPRAGAARRPSGGRGAAAGAGAGVRTGLGIAGHRIARHRSALRGRNPAARGRTAHDADRDARLRHAADRRLPAHGDPPVSGAAGAGATLQRRHPVGAAADPSRGRRVVAGVHPWPVRALALHAFRVDDARADAAHGVALYPGGLSPRAGAGRRHAGAQSRQSRPSERCWWASRTICATRTGAAPSTRW